jgi:glycine/D-amino acid oxidase-like deaminating enzyme
VRNGDVSFWWHHLGLPAPHEPLAGDVDADVCIVGAGLTGLWTAYYLAEADPGLHIVVCEQRFAGYGASGRNGGWLTGALAGSRERFEATHGRAGVLALQEAMHQAVDEVIAVCAAQGIDADLVKGGELQVATSPAQLHRVRAAVTEDRRWGLVDTELLDAGAVAERVRVSGALGGSFTPHCARLHPAKLVAGLATLVRGRGVAIYEQTPVTGIEPGLVRTAAGTVHAPVVLRATEGFTARLPGLRRTWLPMNSSLVVTEPLEADVWAEIGWAGSETLGDAAHGYCYAQRTADGRIALGGRGKPYRFGSRVDTDGHTPQATVDALQSLLHRLFPAVAGVPLAHAWSGVLGVPRDWCSTVGFDPKTGLGWAGGYVGHGVTTTNLAGRTLRDLVLGRDSDLTALPWVDRRVRRWEPEPLRWLGVNALYTAYRAADRLESRPGAGPRTVTLAHAADRISGRH